MYNLVRDLIGNVPKMKDTEFVTFKRTCWLKYWDTGSGHCMSVYYDFFMGGAYFIKKDCSSNSSETIRIPIEKLESAGLLI